tara:strand:- start:33 stop:344 length:312 start_codon:yes stop_codon:yes gene_type:complete
MAFKMNGWSAFTKTNGESTTPDNIGSDAWRAKFLKEHGVTNSEVNKEMKKIDEEEDDVDFDDWKALVMKIKKMKSSELEKKTTTTGLPQEEYQPLWENADEVD